MELKVRNIPMMYSEMMITMNMHGVEEDSRNGPVLSIQQPLMVTVINPRHRVNIDRLRRCNPFFHLMEFVWMMAGERDVEWIAQFNKKMWDFAEPDGYIHGAYGWRWRKHFFGDQIYHAIDTLTYDSTSRRAVLSMWSPENDMYGGKKDLPCNTHVYLRIIHGHLDMTVCNRSNDVIWGMTGANAVHMTLLQELIANAVGVVVGHYTVMTNNAHVYLDLPNVREMLGTTGDFSPNKLHEVHVDVLAHGETYIDLVEDCINLVNGKSDMRTVWMDVVALPAYALWFDRDGPNGIVDTNWEQACTQWLLNP